MLLFIRMSKLVYYQTQKGCRKVLDSKQIMQNCFEFKTNAPSITLNLDMYPINLFLSQLKSRVLEVITVTGIKRTAKVFKALSSQLGYTGRNTDQTVNVHFFHVPIHFFAFLDSTILILFSAKINTGGKRKTIKQSHKILKFPLL